MGSQCCVAQGLCYTRAGQCAAESPHLMVVLRFHGAVCATFQVPGLTVLRGLRLAHVDLVQPHVQPSHHR